MSIKRLFLSVSLLGVFLITGCPSNSVVPLAGNQELATAKSFPKPQEDQSGLYIYRDSFAGRILKKDIYVDDKCIGATADKVFFYVLVSGGQTHKVTTESEFSPNDLFIFTEAGKNYFVRQHIKMGVFASRADLSVSSEQEGMRVIGKADVHLATQGICEN